MKKLIKVIIYLAVCGLGGLLAGSATGFAAKHVSGIDAKLDSLEASYEGRAALAYKSGYLDGSRAVLFLQLTDTLTPEKFDEHFQADSAKYQREWIGIKR